MRVVIADDERLARFNLAYLLRDLMPEAEVHEVEDGVQLIEAVQRWQPELVLADIAMPRLDGLGAIEQLAGQAPGTRFVVITAHADFEYARRGIGLGVSDYLLKPVDSAELAAVVDHATRDLARDRKQRATTIRATLTNKLQEAAAGRGQLAAPVADEDDGAAYLAAVLWVDRPRGQLGDPRARDCLEAVSRTVESDRSCAVIDLGRAGAALLARLLPGREMHMVNQLHEGCASRSVDGLLLSSLWCRGDTPNAALCGIAPALSRPELRLLGRPGAAWPAPDWLARAGDTRISFVAELDRVLEVAMTGDEVRYRAAVGLLREHYPSLPSGLYPGELAGFASVVFGHPFAAANLTALYDALAGAADQLGRRAEPRASSRIGLIQEHINQNYAKPLSLSGVAKRYHMSPNYLSTLFHEKTGRTFVRYLTEVRLAKARNILQDDPDTKIKDLAGLVGFRSVRHFSQVFQRANGHLPSEFARSQARTTDGPRKG